MYCFWTGETAPILALYNLDGDEEIVVTVGREISIFYEGTSEDENYVPFEANIDDGKCVDKEESYLFLNFTKLTYILGGTE